MSDHQQKDGSSGRTLVAPVPGMEDAVRRYVTLREEIEGGRGTWLDLTRFFTDDIVYIDPAWGRVEGIDAVREFLVESMVGLEDWRFPVTAAAVTGDMAIVKWDQVLPGTRPDGSRCVQSGLSTLVYGGDGRFRYEEDVLNMSHVMEDLGSSRWSPGAGFNFPPAVPNRNFSLP